MELDPLKRGHLIAAAGQPLPLGFKSWKAPCWERTREELCDVTPAQRCKVWTEKCKYQHFKVFSLFLYKLYVVENGQN